MKNTKRIAILNLLLVVAIATAFLFAGRRETAPPQRDFVVEKDVAVPMRDAVVLRADVWRPRSDGPFPVLVYRTPYGRQFAERDYSTFRHAVERGYAVVIQDVRGRYGSAGEFRPYQNEGKDGYDTIEWAARQPWSNGAVGTFGLSYPGAVQWLAAVETPPHLKAMVPAMTFSTPQNFFYASGVPDLSWIPWIWNNILPDARVRRKMPGPQTGREARAAWRQVHDRLQRFLPLGALPDLKELAPYYADWWSHPPDDPWWDWAELHDKYGRVQAAVLNLSGWYDDYYGSEGAVTNYRGLLAARRGTEARTQLLIGPWRHGVQETGATRIGPRDFGPQGGIEYDEVVLNWMDRYLKDIDNGVDHRKPVRTFVMGRNVWRESDGWPPAEPKQTSLYLTDPGKESKAAGLRWEAPTAAESFRTFVSDPAHPVFDPQSRESGPVDYAPLAQRSDLLVYETPLLENDLEVTGFIRAEIFLSCDCRDTDLWVRLLDVSPDGKALNLMSSGIDGLRASYREIKEGRKLLVPSKVYKLELGNLLTSNVFLRGHRVRVQISASLFPSFSRNLHTGKLESTSSQMQKATIHIYHDAERPSRLILPVVGHAPAT